MDPVNVEPSPYEIWRVAEAIYQENSLVEKTKDAINKYLHEHTNGKIVLKELEERASYPWVLGLFCIQKDDKKVLVVSFQGSNSDIQWIENISTTPIVTKMLLSSMTKTVKAWEEKYVQKYNHKYGKPNWGKIIAFTGHSRGAQFASRCWKGKKVWRITWNGYGVKTGRYHINLATNGDFLTTNPLLSHPEDYIRICDGGHSLYDFKEVVRDRTWMQLLSKQKAKL
ncbi:MAG: hypothetical protein H7A41_06705 [Chlamydiales bacterium]|nr:hypothetical protein [Chlamydiales bacterium]